MTERGERCELCHREVPALTRHHLIPRTRHRKKSTRRTHDLAELRERVCMLCPPCHKQVHALVDARKLEQSFDTVEKLAAHPELTRFVAWVRKQRPEAKVTTYRSRERRDG